jgi:hypothetical protein
MKRKNVARDYAPHVHVGRNENRGICSIASQASHVVRQRWVDLKVVVNRIYKGSGLRIEEK